MKSSELREAFLHFFTQQEHTLVPSAPLVPKNDPTLLFNVAGMVQFKPLWAGLREPLPYTRATSVQKCLRLNDIDLVGTDATHDTFFEMLGNFSFGDYQKREAIRYAWDFITTVMHLPVERLWVTVHETDDEAALLWEKEVGFPAKRIVRMGDEDNFWGPAGGKGPCGTSSEIFWDIKHDGSAGPGPAEDKNERYTEIWNLVFPQFDHQENGSRPLLKYRGIDTGAGLERMLMAVRNVSSIFHTDLFKPLMEVAADTVGVKISTDTWEALAITADHVRAVTFVIAEGVRPSNTKQGYVVRRLLRRALGALYPFGIEKPLLYRMSGQVVEQMRHVYPELEERREQVALMIKGEEERFLKTLEQGMRLFEDTAHSGVIAGVDAFKLYDTFGFPIDLTKMLAKHRDIKVDITGFDKAMQEQREKSRASSFATETKTTLDTSSAGKFVGYTSTELETTILSTIKTDGAEIIISLEENPFYAESGGQLGDTGKIVGKDFEIQITDTTYNQAGARTLHGEFIKGKPLQELAGMKVRAIVNIARRREIERAHTATHLLHSALRKVLGEHVKQEGSLVEPGRLRFDFYHPSPMTPEELTEVERIVYNWIIGNHALVVREMDKKDAEAKGALAFFGEKYGDRVRVVSIPGISTELCGGTHLRATGETGMFLIIAETGVAAGIRRIEALVGLRAWKQMRHLRSILAETSLLAGTDSSKLPKKLAELKQKISEDSKMRERITRHLVQILSERILSESYTVKDTYFVSAKLDEALGREGLRFLADALKTHRERIVGLLTIPDKKGRMAVLCFASKSVAKNYSAGDMLKKVAAKFKGGGGGSATLAEGSITETSLDNLKTVFLAEIQRRSKEK